jgi:S1-C subfamily serine protease
VGETPVGRSVAIEVKRGAATQTLNATLAERGPGVRVYSNGGPGMREFNLEMPEWDVEVPEPPSPPEAPEPPHAGLPPHAPMAPHPPMPPHAWGWKSDVVLKLGNETIDDGDDLREAVTEAEGGQEVTVTVQREGRPVDLKVTIAKPETKMKHRSAGVSM